MKRAVLRLALALGALATLAACGRSIGDECATSTDCSANGDRSCDLSQPGGYCTVEGCDSNSCPDESVCVRFFPERFLSQRCSPACEDLDPASRPPQCPGQDLFCSERTDDCTADEVCLEGGPGSSYCARRSLERRLCAKSCEGNDDCRGGYECRPGNVGGAIPLLGNRCALASFCAPVAR